MKFIRFLVRTRIWVALAAALLTDEYFYLFTASHNPLHAVQTFFLTMTAYLFLDESPFTNKHVFIRMALTGVIVSVGLFPSENVWLLAAGALLVLSYRKWMPSGKNFFPALEWRKIPGVKNGVIAICWLLVSVLQFSPLNAVEASHLYFLLANGCFVFALSLMEDLADMDQDSMRTLASIAPAFTRWLAGGLIIFAAAIYLIQFSSSGMNDILVAALIVLISFRLLWYVRPGVNRDLQGFLIDGMLILKSLLVISH